MTKAQMDGGGMSKATRDHNVNSGLVKLLLTDKLSNCRLFFIDVSLLLVSGHVVIGFRFIGRAIDDRSANRLNPNVFVFWALNFQFIHFWVGWVG